MVDTEIFPDWLPGRHPPHHQRLRGQPMTKRIDPDLEKIVPLLPLKDAANLTPQRARDELVALADSRKDAPLPQPASVTDVVVDGGAGPVPARVYRPDKFPAPTVMFFHGGGWVAGDLYTHDRLARTLCLDLDAVLVSIEYRRPPEVTFPGAFDDCLAATRWAARNVAGLGGDVTRLAVAGDSAGGALAASVAQACRAGGPQLKAQLLMYPATDLVGIYASDVQNGKYPSRSEHGNGCFLTIDAMCFFAGQYLSQAEEALDPRASPLRATDLGGLPPAVVCTPEFDPLRDEGEAYARALKAAGVRVALFREPGMIHGYFAMGAASPAAADARQRACAQFRAMLE
jgi:acetyl esterase